MNDFTRSNLARVFGILILASLSCGRTRVSDDPVTPKHPLEQIRDLYTTLLPTTQDPHGYVDTDRCDSVLLTALLGAGGVPITDMNAARNSEGQWFRRPLGTYHECLAYGESKSTFSRDMVTGLIWYWYTVRDLQGAQDFYKYVTARSLKFGESDGSIDGNSRIYMSPDLMSLLSETIFRLGGPSYIWRLSATRGGSGTVLGFEAHLEVLQIILWGKLTGWNSPAELGAVEAHVNRRPDNALFQYAAGHTDVAQDLLIKHHPHDRLPTTADYCAPLRYEVETVKVCPDNPETHAPIHYMLISKWLLDRAKSP